jgi:hypothetical protein
MTPQALDTSLSANEIAEDSMQSLSRNMTRVGMGLEECDFISANDFKMLMTLVVIATAAFGCIVNGWLI